ncbi:amidohydrolase [Persicobacter diffluens]|uniref:Amidohydrolase n=2 Tax=Persicobacter diffluens TaxID=981 RepID=A0AAN4W3P9_9BACT|nr:amidohydrolase [Persicobacter diffluens]
MWACTSEPKGDRIFYNGAIYTANPQHPKVEAVVTQKGKILFAGEEQQARKFVGASTQAFNLEGKTMTPGLIDAHAHLMGIGTQQVQLNLLRDQSWESIIEKVRLQAEQLPEGSWIQGRGWHQDKWDSLPVLIHGFPIHDELTKAAPNHPVWLKHASGHAGIANQKAMEMAGIYANIKEQKGQLQVNGGEVMLNRRGEPTGLMNENACNLIESKIPTNDASANDRTLQRAIQHCLENGITGLHDAGAGEKTLETYFRALKNQKLPLRLYVMLDGSDAALLEEWAKRGIYEDSSHHLKIRSIKLYTDGALGSSGAWLLAPYEDQKCCHHGHAVTPADTLGQRINWALNHGFQVCAHAIGDQANRAMLDHFQKAFQLRDLKPQNYRFRIEHAQHIHPKDLNRFAEMGVIPSIQTIHFASDRPWAIDKLGKERIEKGSYAWQTLWKSGAIIINGTDAPVEPLNPIENFYAAVSRKTLKGTPEGGYEAWEKLSRQQALEASTANAAFAAFQETISGEIAKGKLADFTIYNQNLMEVPEQEILNTKIMYTIIGDSIYYQNTVTQ